MPGSGAQIPSLTGGIVALREKSSSYTSNSTVDRAALDATVIRRGVKIDNLVMVAHNVEVGENSLLMAQVGIARSSKIGKSVMLAGQVGIADHVIIAAKSGVSKSIPEGSFVAGSPQLPIKFCQRERSAAISTISCILGLQERVPSRLLPLYHQIY